MPETPAQPPAPPPPPASPPAPPPEEKKFAGKYKTVEELEAGYKALETKLGKPADAPKPPETPAGGAPKADALNIPDAPPPKPPAELPDDATPAQILEHVGLKQEDVAAAWNKDKKLTNEQYAAFKAKGLAKAAVDAFLRGQEAEALLAVERGVKLRTSAETLAGGKEQLDSLLAWAAENITVAEKKAMNGRLSDPSLYEGAIIELKARHDAKNPPKQPLVNGGAAPGTMGGGGAFRTTQEMENAIAAAKQQLGETQWHKDDQLMARIKATPQNLKNTW